MASRFVESDISHSAKLTVATGSFGSGPPVGVRAFLYRGAGAGGGRRSEAGEALKPRPYVYAAKQPHDRPRIGGSASGCPAQPARGFRASVHGRCRSRLVARQAPEH